LSSETVQLTRDTDRPSTTDCDSGDWSAEVTQEMLSVVRQEPEVVCCIVCLSPKPHRLLFISVGEFLYWTKLLQSFFMTMTLLIVTVTVQHSPTVT